MTFVSQRTTTVIDIWLILIWYMQICTPGLVVRDTKLADLYIVSLLV